MRFKKLKLLLHTYLINTHHILLFTKMSLSKLPLNLSNFSPDIVGDDTDFSGRDYKGEGIDLLFLLWYQVLRTLAEIKHGTDSQIFINLYSTHENFLNTHGLKGVQSGEYPFYPDLIRSLDYERRDLKQR